MRDYFLVFLGPPGAGKSTIMSVVSSYLNQRGYKALIFYGYKRSFLSSFLETMLCKVLFGSVGKKYRLFPMFLLLRYSKEMFKHIAGLWYVLDVFGIILKNILLKFERFVRRANIILIEDYIPSIMADYMYIAHVLAGRMRLIIKYCIHVLLVLLIRDARITQGKTFLIHLDAGAKQLRNRYIKRGRPELSHEYVVFMRKALGIVCEGIALIASDTHCIKIDTSYLGIKKVASIVIREVFIKNNNVG